MSLNINNNIIIDAPDEPEYHNLLPWHHKSGVYRWIIDNDNPEIEIDGYFIRLRTIKELRTDLLYQTWEEHNKT